MNCDISAIYSGNWMDCTNSSHRTERQQVSAVAVQQWQLGRRATVANKFNRNEQNKSTTLKTDDQCQRQTKWSRQRDSQESCTQHSTIQGRNS